MLMRLAKRRGQRGFTLIELLIVVAIIGIIAAILIPNLLDALQKAKQKATVGDIRNIGTAWMSWVTDQMSAAAAGQSTQTFDWADFGSRCLSHCSWRTCWKCQLRQPELLLHPGASGERRLGRRAPVQGRVRPGRRDQLHQLLQNARVVAIRSLGRDGAALGTTYTPGASSSAPTTTRTSCGRTVTSCALPVV